MGNQKIVIVGVLIVALIIGGLFLVTSDINYDKNLGSQNPSGIQEATNTPDPDKSIDVRNRFDETVNIRVKVRRNSTDEIVYNESYVIEPSEELDSVYNLNKSSPDGIEEYEVIAFYNNTREVVSIHTNGCYGDVFVEVTDSGMLYPYYAIC